MAHIPKLLSHHSNMSVTPRPNGAADAIAADHQPNPSPKLKRTSIRGAKVVEETVQGDEVKDASWPREQKGTTGRQKTANVDEHGG